MSQKQNLYEVSVRVRLWAENDTEARREACYAAASGYGATEAERHNHEPEVREVTVTRVSGYAQVAESPRVLPETWAERKRREETEKAKAENVDADTKSPTGAGC